MNCDTQFSVFKNELTTLARSRVSRLSPPTRRLFHCSLSDRIKCGVDRSLSPRLSFRFEKAAVSQQQCGFEIYSVCQLRWHFIFWRTVLSSWKSILWHTKLLYQLMVIWFDRHCDTYLLSVKFYYSNRRLPLPPLRILFCQWSMPRMKLR